MNVKNDYTKVQYRNTDGNNVLTVGKKEFTHVDHQIKFKESWVISTNIIIKIIINISFIFSFKISIVNWNH